MKANRILSNLALFAAFFSFMGSAANAAEQLLDVTGGSVSFLAIGKPSAIKIRGNGGAPSGQNRVNGKEVTGEFTFELNTLNTGIELRDHHMKEKYLQTDKNPMAKFKITKLTLPSEFKQDGFKSEKVPVEGDLTLNGITQPVKGSASIACSAGLATAHIEFGTSIPDYKIEIPTYMGVKVADHVDVQVDVQAHAAASAKSPAKTGSAKK